MLGAASVAWTDFSGRAGVRPRIEVLRDPAASLRIDDMVQAGGAFVEATNPLGLGYADGAVWIRLSMTRAADLPALSWLEVVPPHLNQVSLFVPHDGNGPAFTRIDGGIAVLKSQRWLEQPQTLYLRVALSGLFAADVQVWQPQGYLEHAAWVSLSQRMYYGVWGASFWVI